MKQLISTAMACAALALILIASPLVRAQNKTFKWSDALCDFSGTYNSKKYTPRPLADTLKLWQDYGAVMDASATVFTPDDLPKLSVEKLDAEYKRKAAQISALQIVATPYWDTQRRAKLSELKQVYELSRVTIRGHTDPRALMEAAGVEECKTKYAAPLVAGGDALLTAWRLVNEDSRRNNSDPERLRRLYEAQLASADRMKYALVEVMTFGWWNCANQSIKYVEYDGTQEREFEKLFVRVRRHCDEP